MISLVALNVVYKTLISGICLQPTTQHYCKTLLARLCFMCQPAWVSKKVFHIQILFL